MEKEFGTGLWGRRSVGQGEVTNGTLKALHLGFTTPSLGMTSNLS